MSLMDIQRAQTFTYTWRESTTAIINEQSSGMLIISRE